MSAPTTDDRAAAGTPGPERSGLLRPVPLLAATVGLALLLLLQLTLNRSAIEQRLERDAVDALSRTGVKGARVSVSGRDVTLVGAAVDSELRDDVVDSVRELEGVRVVRWQGAGQVDAKVGAEDPDATSPDSAPSPSSAAASPSAAVEPTPTSAGTPAPNPGEAAAADARKLEQDLSELPEVEFRYGADEVSPSSQQTVRRAAELIRRARKGVTVTVEGHTDLDGSLAFNNALSTRRANAVKDALVEAGVPAAQLEAIGYGETRPIAEGTSLEANIRNRRVIFEVSAR